VDLATYFDQEQLEEQDSDASGRRVLHQPVTPGKTSCILKVRSPVAEHRLRAMAYVCAFPASGLTAQTSSTLRAACMQSW
jgi:hypothetical protein